MSWAHLCAAVGRLGVDAGVFFVCGKWGVVLLLGNFAVTDLSVCSLLRGVDYH